MGLVERPDSFSMAERSRDFPFFRYVVGMVLFSSRQGSNWLHHRKPTRNQTILSYSQGFLLPGNRTGLASAAMA